MRSVLIVTVHTATHEKRSIRTFSPPINKAEPLCLNRKKPAAARVQA
jgi:hypothetical protein